jgi:hypothetical protein
MDQDTIRKIAQEIVRQLPSYSWQLLAVQVVLVLVAFGGGALFGAYLRLRTIKADVDAAPVHDHDGAKPIETVATDLGQENWRTREWSNLRRIKLEALLSRMHDCEPYLEQLRHRPAKSANPEERDPLSELEVITTLYFPELKAEVDDYVGKCRAQKNTILEARSDARKSDAPLQPLETGGTDLGGTEFDAVRDRLNLAARNLTVQIMGVGE